MMRNDSPNIGIPVLVGKRVNDIQVMVNQLQKMCKFILSLKVKKKTS